MACNDCDKVHHEWKERIDAYLRESSSKVAYAMLRKAYANEGSKDGNKELAKQLRKWVDIEGELSTKYFWEFDPRKADSIEALSPPEGSGEYTVIGSRKPLGRSPLRTTPIKPKEVKGDG